MAPVFIDFLEGKLIEHGIRKIVPDRDILERHARRVIEQRLVDALVRDSRIALQAAEIVGLERAGQRGGVVG